LLIIIRLLHGIAFGAASTATGTIVAQIIPDSRRGEGIGCYSMGAILAVAVGPFVGIFLIHGVDFNMIFVVTSILAAGSFALSFIVAQPTYLAPEPDQVGAVKSFQLSDFLVYAVTVFISRPLSGRLLDIRGANFVVYPSLFIYAIGMLLFSQANHGMALLLAGVLIGLGYGNFISSAQAISIKGLPPHRLGLATSTFFIFVDLGFGVGPYLLGSLVPLTGYRGLYVIMAIVILTTIPLYYFLYGRKSSSE